MRRIYGVSHVAVLVCKYLVVKFIFTLSDASFVFLIFIDTEVVITHLLNESVSDIRSLQSQIIEYKR